ncbi:hypothetical protein ZWY2020_012169 [Hordeum vulgare]|nr:hypothetical protein ZWY2020_012169 [Hordeum vulgare]
MHELCCGKRHPSSTIHPPSALRATSHLPARLPLQWILISFFLLSTAAGVTDKLERGQKLTDGETLVSAGGSFTLGFFSPGASTKRYLGIWFSVSNAGVVWVANRDQPLLDKSGTLVLNDVGSLVLGDSSGRTRTAWSSRTMKISACTRLREKQQKPSSQGRMTSIVSGATVRDITSGHAQEEESTL